MNEETYEGGVQAAKAFYTCKSYAAFSYDIDPKDAARLFLPGVTEMMSQMQMPLPKSRKAWLDGFRDEQQRILNITL